MTTIEPLAIARQGAQIAHDKLGEEIELRDVREILRIADYFVLITGRNARHVRSIAAELDVRMKKLGVPKARIEGDEDGHWVLLDFDDVVFHVLDAESRAYYGLERLWADAPKVDWEPENRTQAAG